MELLIVSFVAGILTIAAPCILPLLPVVVGGSMLHAGSDSKRPSLLHPILIVSSLVVSVILFTLLLKATTIFLGVPAGVWNVIAGGIVALLGVHLLVPSLWERFMIGTGLQASSQRLMGGSQQKAGALKDILLGVSLGPVFNSCSPTYALIVALILPTSFGEGLVYLGAYAIGLGLTLLLVALFGQSLTRKMRWLSNPGKTFSRVIGIVFILVGIFVMTGLDKKVQTYVLENGWYDPIMKVEEAFKQ